MLKRSAKFDKSKLIGRVKRQQISFCESVKRQMLGTKWSANPAQPGRGLWRRVVKPAANSTTANPVSETETETKTWWRRQFTCILDQVFQVHGSGFSISLQESTTMVSGVRCAPSTPILLRWGRGSVLLARTPKWQTEQGLSPAGGSNRRTVVQVRFQQHYSRICTAIYNYLQLFTTIYNYLQLFVCVRKESSLLF